jgi:hypothetical protein
MMKDSATVLLVCLWVSCCFPSGLPEMTDDEVLDTFYRWVQENRDRDWRVGWFVRLAECEARVAAAPWD